MSRFFIRRPIVAIVIAILFVVGGAVMVFRLPVAQFPEIAPPVVSVALPFPGESPDQVERDLIDPIEEGISSGRPSGPITVVCSAWYMFAFGMATKSLNRPGIGFQSEWTIPIAP